eukprot:1443539-Rhodomonas_salina.2
MTYATPLRTVCTVPRAAAFDLGAHLAHVLDGLEPCLQRRVVRQVLVRDQRPRALVPNRTAPLVLACTASSVYELHTVVVSTARSTTTPLGVSVPSVLSRRRESGRSASEFWRRRENRVELYANVCEEKQESGRVLPGRGCR